MRFPGFLGGSYQSQSSSADMERLMNWYLEPVESEAGKASPVLYPTPGFTAFVTLPASPVRGVFAQNDRTFAVAGAGLYELLREGAYLDRALTAIATPGTPVITHSPPKPTLSTPGAPTISQVGTPGSTAYGYKIAATTVLGATAASPEGTTATGFATLTASNANLVQWSGIVGAQGYKVWRTTGGSAPPKLIATITNGNILSFLDSGEAGTADTPPTSTTTAGTGATAVGYQVAATTLSGSTAASAEGTSAIGWATLTSTEYNVITWVAVTNATGYKVWRTTGYASPPKLIATVSGGNVVSVRDFGQDALGGTAPVTILGTFASGAPFSGTDATAGNTDIPPTVNTTLSSGVTDDGSPVTISSSGDGGQQLFIVSGGRGLIFDLATATFTDVVVGATMGGYIDGYFVALDAATSTFKMSNLLDGVTWDSTQIAQRLSGADRWLAMIIVHREIWLFGSHTTEVWYDAGTAPFPFAPMPSVFLEKGIVAPFSAARVDASVMWLGQDDQGSGVVFRANGYTPERVSTHALEYALQGYTTLADAHAWTYQDQGHTFYVLTFPAEGKTWVYDARTGGWAERGWWNTTTASFEAYRPQCHAFAFSGLSAGKHLVGDRASGVVYDMDIDAGTDVGGGLIRRVRRAPHLSGEEARVAYTKLELVMEVGLGLRLGQGAENTVMLRWSDDAGKTWSHEHWTSAGRIGTYRTRVRWTRLGSGRDRVFEVSVTDPVPYRLVDAVLQVDAGTH